MAAPTPGPRCGEYAGRAQHQKRGEEPCEACRAAAAAYQRERRAERPGAYARDRYWCRTRETALEQLAREYPARFLEILTEVRDAEPLPEMPHTGRKVTAP